MFAYDADAEYEQIQREEAAADAAESEGEPDRWECDLSGRRLDID